MINGSVRFFNEDRGYGFIAPDDGGSDVFVDVAALLAAGIAAIRKDQRVSFELQTDRRGRRHPVRLQANPLMAPESRRTS